MPALELLDCGFGERAKVAGDGVGSEMALREEELLELGNVRATHTAGEVAREIRTRRATLRRGGSSLSLQRRNLCKEKPQLCLKFFECGGVRGNRESEGGREHEADECGAHTLLLYA